LIKYLRRQSINLFLFQFNKTDTVTFPADETVFTYFAE
jgi:hypothetical protein